MRSCVSEKRWKVSIKMIGTLPDDRYPNLSSRFRITTSPAIKAHGNAGRSKLSTAFLSACSALSCSTRRLSGCFPLQAHCPTSSMLGFIGQARGRACAEGLSSDRAAAACCAAQQQLQPSGGGIPRAIAIWIPEIPGSMHQCLPWLPPQVFLYFWHATALKTLCEAMLRACCSTMPISFFHQILKQPKLVLDNPHIEKHFND